jgi:hypothetical protein
MAAAVAVLEKQCMHDRRRLRHRRLPRGEWEFDFIVVLNGEPLGIQRLPDKFTEFFVGNELAALQLWEAGCGFFRWPVDVLFDRHGKRCTSTQAGRSSRASMTSKPVVCSHFATKMARR